MSESFSLEIASSLRPYSLRIGHGLAQPLVADTSLFLVADGALSVHFPWLAAPGSFELAAEESEKTLATVTRIIESLRDRGMDRQSHLLAIGGGIVQDVATAAASLYMRGIRWTYCPTTLLGMVDSCIGGKSSLNVGRYKNIAGNFYPPQEILVDTAFCKSLPPVQRAAGLCEAVKICFAQRGDAFERYLALIDSAGVEADLDTLTAVIALSLGTKKVFIEDDEFDQGVRLLLNFGHTFGHAIEAASSFAVSHGVAVGLGMLAARNFSIQMGWLPAGNERALALVRHVRKLLAQVPDLRAQFAQAAPEDALARFRLDKKHRKNEFAIIGLDQDGQLQRRFVPRDGHTESLVQQSFARLADDLP